MRVSIKEVPFDVRRLAAQHLESMRGTEIMRGIEAACLGEQVVPIYRPDIEDVAYWEFSVIGAGESRRVLKSVGYDGKCPSDSGETGIRGGPPVGFIIASNGRHDFPITHWSLDRLPPSLQIAKDARPCDNENIKEGEPERLYRLDALSYVAESKDGEIVGQSGQIPTPIQGLPHNLEHYAGQIISSVSRVLRPERTDESGDGAKHDVERSEFTPPKLNRSDEGGWKALKERYADSFGPLLDQLRRRASKTWEIEDAIRQYGEGIIAGMTHRVALLGEACVELTGDGTKYVRATIEENGPPALVLTVASVSVPHEMDFEAIVTYQDGKSERLRFFVVSRDVPSNTKAEQERNRSTDCEE